MFKSVLNNTYESPLEERSEEIFLQIVDNAPRNLWNSEIVQQAKEIDPAWMAAHEEDFRDFLQFYGRAQPR